MADHTAAVRCRVPRTAWSEGSASMTRGSRRYMSRTRLGLRPEDLLAQQRVELHAAEALLLLVDRRDPAGLVVDDLELAVGGDVEPVDDAPQPEAGHVGLEGELDAHGVDGVGVLEPEVAVDERGGVGHEGVALGLGQLQVGQVGLVLERLPRQVERMRGPLPGCARRGGGPRRAARARCARGCP